MAKDVYADRELETCIYLSGGKGTVSVIELGCRGSRIEITGVMYQIIVHRAG